MPRASRFPILAAAWHHRAPKALQVRGSLHLPRWVFLGGSLYDGACCFEGSMGPGSRNQIAALLVEVASWVSELRAMPQNPKSPKP